MGFADYFLKNEHAGALLLKGLDPGALKRILNEEVVGLAFDHQATRSPEGRAGLDLTVRILARLYPKLAIFPISPGAGAFSEELRSLARRINPRIGCYTTHKSVTRLISFGKTSIERPHGMRGSVIYAGSDNWVAKISTKAPIPCGRTCNPFGAGMAACIATSNLFRSVFSRELGNPALDDSLAVSVLDLKATSTPTLNPPYEGGDLGTVHLVGAGAIGNGFLWALAHSNCTGHLHVIDPEIVEQSNLQRYVMSDVKAIGKVKSDLAADWAQTKKLKIYPHSKTWEAFADSVQDRRFQMVAVALDNAQSRIHVQASLPRFVFNSWTQAGEAGISRHTFDNDEACLACLYLPQKTSPNFDQLVRQALKLPDDPATVEEVRRRLAHQTLNDRALLEKIAVAASVPLNALLPYEGHPLRKLYVEAICGGAIMEFGNEQNLERADVPMAFQSALAGILMAADVVAHCASIPRKMPTLSQIDLLRPYPIYASQMQRKTTKPACICCDEDYLAAYREKFGKHVTTLP